MTGWRTLFGAGSLAVLVSACGALPGAPPPPPPEPTVAPTVVPTVARVAASPSAAPSSTVAAPTATAAATAATTSNTVWVGNTDGEGVFVRKTPAMADRARAYPDGTPLTIVGDDVDGDGQHWKHVTTPDGLEGYVPAMYTVEVQ